VRLPLYCVPGWKERRRRGTGGRIVKVEKSIDKCRNNRYTFFERNTGCRVEAGRSRTMLEKIKEILVEQLNCDADSINEDTSFKDDLGADSLDLYEMVMALEDEYGIEIDTDELTDLSTVGDFMEYLKQHGVEV
jgi:acyl carrier protein